MGPYNKNTFRAFRVLSAKISGIKSGSKKVVLYINRDIYFDKITICVYYYYFINKKKTKITKAKGNQDPCGSPMKPLERAFCQGKST